MAFGPSGKPASNINAGDESGVSESSPPSPARLHAGFAERTALFRNVLDLPVELHALQSLADPQFLRFAASRAEQLGVSADLIVARSGLIDSDAMLAAYAADLGVAVNLLEDAAATPIEAAEVLASGVVPAEGGERPTIALLPGTVSALYERAAREGRNFRITSAERLRAFVERSAEDALAQAAAFELRDTRPELSAATLQAGNRVAFCAALFAAALAFYLAPGPSRLAVEILLAVVFLNWAGLRLFACFLQEQSSKYETVSDRDLPVYTVLIPLHREARVVVEIIGAISALNYPREKLDVKLILEPDDETTITAVKAIKLDPCFEIIYAPLIGPRTKPKALRAAMPFVRGDFVVVYDAEDRPHPEQLRDAYAEFCAGGRELACVQAKLAIDNAFPFFLPAHFRAEYSGLFDVLLPALVRLRLPLPLGGTSNHFRGIA